MATEPMKTAPEILKVKCALRDILSTGDQAAIAAILGVKPQDISQRYSTESDRKPGAMEFLRESWAICAVNEDAGWKLKAYIEGFFDSWLTPVKASDKNVTTLIREGHESYGDLVSARLEGKPLNELREELRRVRKAIDQLESALDQEFELRAEPTPIRRATR